MKENKDKCKCGCEEGNHEKTCGCSENNHEKTCGCGGHCHNHENDKVANEVTGEALGYLELAQRIQADFENYKKRNAEIAKKSYESGVNDFVLKLLPVLDSFKQARSTVTDEQALSGLNLIHGQIIKALNSFGINKIECVGKEFDPNYHNAVLTDSNPEYGNDVITEELQEGFMSENKVIRHSVVKVNKI